MESFFSRYKNALVLIVVLFAQVIGVAIQVRRPLPKEHAQPDAGGVRLIRYWAISIVSPPERFVHWLGVSILGVWDNYLDLIHVRQQNKDLQAELRRLRIEQGGIAEDARQGQRLQTLLGFQEKYIYHTVPAQIIGTSGSEQSRILSIDKGAKDGVAVDMPVITPDGIVGRVREVFPHTSQVIEISDPTSGAGVLLATTRIRGILRGNALGQPQVTNVMPDDRIKPGEAVVTSGGDQIFPRGLPVGFVDKVSVDPERDPMVDIVIRPAANLSRLEEVLVITNMGDAVTPREKLDLIQSQAVANAEQLKASEILAERLPTRVDPDAPKDETNSDASPDAEGEGIGRPMRPPAALHPDRFSPNTTPAATTLTPGARLAPQSEGVLSKPAVAPKPKPAAPTNRIDNGDVPDATTAATAAAASRKKNPELVPDDGSRPPAGMAEKPATPQPQRAPSTAPFALSPRDAAAGATPIHAPRPVTPSNGAGGTAATPAAHVPAAGTTAGTATHSTANPSTANATPRTPSTATGAATHTPSATGTATSTPRTPAPPANAQNTTGDQNSAVKTHVVVDGPLPSAARKPATTSTAPSGTQPRPQSSTQNGTQPRAQAGAQAGQTAPRTPSTNSQPGQARPQAQHQSSQTGTNPQGNAPRPQNAAPAQRKSPELVPDDGSRPPPSMLQRPKPQQQQPTAQPQGGR